MSAATVNAIDPQTFDYAFLEDKGEEALMPELLLFVYGLRGCRSRPVSYDHICRYFEGAALNLPAMSFVQQGLCAGIYKG